MTYGGFKTADIKSYRLIVTVKESVSQPDHIDFSLNWTYQLKPFQSTDPFQSGDHLVYKRNLSHRLPELQIVKEYPPECATTAELFSLSVSFC